MAQLEMAQTKTNISCQPTQLLRRNRKIFHKFPYFRCSLVGGGLEFFQLSNNHLVKEFNLNLIHAQSHMSQ